MMKQSANESYEQQLGTGRTGGRDATTGVIPGRFAISIGKPELPAPPGWVWTALSDVAQLESGHTPSRRMDDYWNGGIPWIGIKDATGNHGKVIFDTFQHVSQKGLDNSSARLLPEGTVCLSRTASVGFVVVMGRAMATSQDFINWVCGPKINNHYLKYALVGENEALWRFSRGTTHQTIYYPEAKAFHVCLPPIQTQNAIVEILFSLDKRIELCRRMNETLEAMARALFKDWFIDFGPVRAKMEGREPPGLSPEIAAIFPSKLVDSELGEIPEGWVISTIGNEVRAVGGGTPSTKESEFWDNGCHFWATPKDLSKLQFPVILETERKISDAGLAKISSGLLPVGTLLLSSRAPIGYTAITEVPLAINQGFIAMICDKRIPNIFAYFWCKENMDRIVGNANGSTFQEISKSNFRPLAMIVPSVELLSEFSDAVGDLHQQLVSNQKQVASLSTLRDTLLPKLLSGELSIPEAMLQAESL